MKNTKIYKIMEEVQKLLNDNYVCADVYHTGLPNTISVDIKWGDWKHSHLRAQYLIQSIGGRLVNSVVTEDNDSDCYSAVHTFAFDI